MSTPARGWADSRGRQLARWIVSLTLGTLTVLAGGCSSGQNAAILRNGHLRVVIVPTAAANAGARWTIDGGATQYPSGTTLDNLAIGNHTVAFTAVAGYTTPAAQTVSVMTPLSTITGTYVAGGGGGGGGGVVNPQANAGADQTITLPAGATLNGTATPNAATPAWTMVSSSTGGTVNFANANSASTTATFSQAGVYVLRLTATNGTATANDDVTVTVNPAPTPTLSSVSPAQGTVGTAVTATLTGTNFAAGATLAVSGAGVTVSNTNVASATSITALFTIAANAATGARNVTVTSGGVTTAAVTFTVAAPAVLAPVVRTFSPANYVPGQPVTVTLTATVPGTASSWGITETPPAGWTITAYEGTGGDLSGGQINWVFLDATSRTLSYVATPPAGTSGTQTFAGTYNDAVTNGGRDATIDGATSITP